MSLYSGLVESHPEEPKVPSISEVDRLRTLLEWKENEVTRLKEENRELRELVEGYKAQLGIPTQAEIFKRLIGAKTEGGGPTRITE